MGVKVIKPGTKVKSVIGKIDMIVIGVCIREGWIEYHLSYFFQGEHRSCWLQPYEFEIITAQPKKAGFVNYDQDQSDTNFLIDAPHE